MTVITMQSSEKKSDNVPLVTNIEVDPATEAKDLEAGNVKNDRSLRSKYLVLRVINDRVYSFWALIYVLLMSLLIVFMMLYGEYIYKAVGNAFNKENDTFHGTESIAFDKLQAQEIINDDYDLPQISDFEKTMDNYAANMENLNRALMNVENVVSEYKENFELDLKGDSYEKIVPDLSLSNSARFIHDFSTNITGIVDIEGKQCFVMPLNRSSVLPPVSFNDLMYKITNDYYALDTRNVMHNMRVVKPAIEDLTEYGMYIAKDCEYYPTYKLEKIVSGVYKRSVSPTPTNGKTFTEFAGKMESYRIVNYYDNDSQ